MIIPTEIVTGFHTDIINESGGAHGIHDANLLDSAVNNIYATFDKIDLYPTIIEKATRLSFFLNMNHPFVGSILTV